VLHKWHAGCLASTAKIALLDLVDETFFSCFFNNLIDMIQISGSPTEGLTRLRRAHVLPWGPTTIAPSCADDGDESKSRMLGHSRGAAVMRSLSTRADQARCGWA